MEGLRKGAFGAAGAVLGVIAVLVTAGCAMPPGGPDAAVAENPDEGVFQTPAGLYLAGRQAEQEGDRASAATFMARALALDPGNVEFLRNAFQLALGEGRYPEADQLARRLIAALPEDHLANLFLALEDAKAGNWDGAATRVAHLPKARLGSVNNPIVQAWSLAGEGKTDEAIAALNQLEAVRGFAVLRDLHAAYIDDLAGRAVEAEDNYKRALISEGNPSFRVIESLANFYARHDRLPDAMALFDRFKQQNANTVRLSETIKELSSGRIPPPEVPDARVGLAEAMFDIGSALRQEETERLSLQFMRLALYMAPDLTIAQLALADLLSADQRDPEALVLYGSVPPSSPLYFSARLRAADTLHNMKKTDDAIVELDRLAAAWPDRAEPLATEGDFLRAAERFADAVKAYDRAMARIKTIQPSDWSFFYARGVALERSGQWPRAEQDFLEALKLSPDQPGVLNYLGYSWVDRGEHLDQAKDMIERAVMLKPDDGYIVDSLGWVQYREGDFQRAVASLERAVELKPDDPVINDHLGDAYWRVGRQNEARFQWRRALSLKPEPDLQTQLGLKLQHGLSATSKTGEHDS